MKIFVKVKPGASSNQIEQIDATHYVVSTTEPPVKGRANAAVIKQLADYLQLPKSLLAIKRGETAKQKTIEILTDQNLFDK